MVFPGGAMRKVQSNTRVSEATYAIAGDFCRIFTEEMNGLYQLSYLLTGDAARAEQCFVSGLEDCAGSNRVFKDWARSWARRTVIQNAIRLLQPSPGRLGSVNPAAFVDEEQSAPKSDLMAALLALPVFGRFVFVMSVLEGISDQECKTLLGCSRRDIVRARAQAVIRMATLSGTRTNEVASQSGSLFHGPALLPQTA
jgi:DNA-directed RNA polymerase specialized sigma24 family protein